MDELRVLKKTELKAQWADIEIRITPKPFRELESVLKAMDELAAREEKKATDVGFFLSVYQNNVTDFLRFLRFFVTLPDGTTDEWLIEHLDMQVIVWLINMVKEVNKFDYIQGFFRVPGMINPAKR